MQENGTPAKVQVIWGCRNTAPFLWPHGGYNMKCPYAVTRSTTSQTVYEYGEDGEMTMQQTVDHNEAKFVDCLEGNCAAWQNGRCQYRGE
nr:MAG TPA: hypothetical protein [Caudoviricetes sp.]